VTQSVSFQMARCMETSITIWTLESKWSSTVWFFYGKRNIYYLRISKE